jgi:hypothetical protein
VQLIIGSDVFGTQGGHCPRQKTPEEKPLKSNKNKTMESTNKGWGLSTVWNTALEDMTVRPMTPRKKLWASEIGKAPVDLFLKLKGTEPSNPPNARAMRKFEAGNVFEWIVSLVLKRANVLQAGQSWCEHTYPGMLPVSGKADFIAGGKVDGTKARDFIAFLQRAEIPDVFLRCFDKVIEHLEKKYPEGLKEQPLEVKSISSFAADLMERSDKPIRNHRIQLFHYLKALNYPQGQLIYICRDDLRMFEYVVQNPSPVEDEYRTFIETISGYVLRDEMPPKEKFIVWDEDGKKFSKNLNVSWSNYLTLLYGFKEPREYDEPYGKLATNWNRVLKRVKTGAKMTAKNIEILDAIKAGGFNVDELVAQLPDEPVTEEEEV